MKRNWLWVGVGVAAAVMLVLGIATDFLNGPGKPADDPALKKITFATDWKAQAEHGGFYQAKALGLYEARGLDVDILMGGPAINIPQLLATGQIDFGLGSNQFLVFNMALSGVPAKAVMATFQKDPQVIITHPRTDVASLADLKGKPIMVADATIGSFWLWLKAKYGYTDDQVRKYTFNLAPFLSDPLAVQQGYLTSEPYIIEAESGIKPQVFMLSDEGYPGYAAFVLARTNLIESDPETVRAFVAASIEGWQSYLDDPSAGNALIRADNPEMTDDVIAQAIDKMKANHLLVPPGGDAKAIGAMSRPRLEQFLAEMAPLGLYPADFDIDTLFTGAFLPEPASDPQAP